MKTVRIAPVAAFIATSLLALVSAQADIPRPGPRPQRIFHYSPSVKGVTWAPGCGARPPEGAPPCHYGAEITYMPNYADLTLSLSAAVSGANITVHIDTWSRSQIHSRMMVRPMTVPLSVTGRGLHVGTRYHVTVVNHAGAKIWTGSMTPTPPAP